MAAILPDVGTGWRYHVAAFQIIIMTKGWARFMYEDKEFLVEAGDVVQQSGRRNSAQWIARVRR